jgi:hypothetical protein
MEPLTFFQIFFGGGGLVTSFFDYTASGCMKLIGGKTFLLICGLPV